MSFFRAMLLLGSVLWMSALSAQTIRLATNPDEAPYTDRNKADGGIATRKVMAALRAAGLQPELEWMPWRQALAKATSGAVDITFPFLKTKEREQSFLYSDPIYHDESYLWTRIGSSLSIDRPADFAGKTICIPKGYSSPLQTLLAAQIEKKQVRVEQPESPAKCVQMVTAGHADALSGQEFEIGPLLHPFGGLVHAPKPIMRLSFYALFSRKSPNAEEKVGAFNAAMARLDRDAQNEAEQFSSQLTVVTEEFPPYQFVENGKPAGMSVEVVQAALAEAGITTPISILPWTRALKMAQERPNVLIFSMARTAEREHQFKWIGQVNQSENYIYALPGRLKPLSSLDFAKGYVVGTVLGDIREDYFVKRGFPVQSVREHELNYARLKAGRIDLWPTTQAVMTYFVRKAGDDPAKAVVPVWKIDDLHVGYSGDFLAASLSTPDALIERLHTALDQIKNDGRFAAIEHKWTQ